MIRPFGRAWKELTVILRPTTGYLIAPSILAADFLHLGDQIAVCEQSGADWIHVDVMDGHFVPNLTMGAMAVEACRRATRLPIDVHLMIENPERHLEAFANAGASILTAHVEACSDPLRTLNGIKALGCKAGVTLNPETPVRAIEPFLSLVDLVLIMSVHPGYAGQQFLPEALVRITETNRMLNELDSSADLEVDGGISAATLPAAREAGANVFVAAQAIFKHPEGIRAGIRALRELLPAD